MHFVAVSATLTGLLVTTVAVNMQVLISKDKHVAGRVREHVEGLEAEVNVLRRLDHPNIVRYLVRPHPTPLQDWLGRPTQTIPKHEVHAARRQQSDV